MRISGRNRAVVAAAALAAMLTACGGSPSKQSAGDVFDDTVITGKVKAKMVNDPVVSGFGIQVETFKGVVQLSGFVDSARERQRAGAIASQVAGVKRVENDIELK